jgi:hypothetical protein
MKLTIKGSLVFLIATYIAQSTSYSKTLTYDIKKWKIPKALAVKYYFATPAYEEVSIKSNAGYKNELMNQFLIINPKLISKIKIIKSKNIPYRDLLFVENKLYSIKEEHHEIDSSQFQKLYLTLKNIYGYPAVSKKKNISTYSFKTPKTEVLLITEPVGEQLNVTIYFYDHYWIRTIILITQ